jgi:uncharacterized membrane protein HdeD (DUF308 family)
MTANSPSNNKRMPRPSTGAIRDHWMLFLVEGIALIVLGLIAVVVPSITNASTTFVLGWIFVVSGAVGLVTTYWAQQAPGYWWSLVSALLAIFVGVVLTTNKSQGLYGTLMVWPFEDASPLQLILIVFFLVEGGASIMFAIEHRRQSSGRWAWTLASGITDIVLASIVLASIIAFDIPSASAWTALLVGINMMLGGFALFAMGSHARSEHMSSNPVPPRDL